MAFKPFIKLTKDEMVELPICAEKIGTNTIGSLDEPVFIDGGIPKVCSSLKTMILNYIYPIGSYFITESSSLNTTAKVASHFGGAWTQLDAGRFLESVTSGAGSNKDAGLPNITGYFTGTLNGNNGGNGVHSGACYLYNVNSDSNNWGGNSGWNNTSTEGFDASRSNSIYGNSTTVQPKSRTVYVYRRTA